MELGILGSLIILIVVGVIILYLSVRVVKQYEKMFELDGIGLTFDKDAIEAIARKTLDRGTGARGLRSVIEDVMREVMFDLPSRTDVREVVVTAEAVDRGVQPLLVLHPEAQEDRRREA